MTDNDVTNIYRASLEQYGISYKSLNWGSQKSQFLRFKVLSEIADLSGSTVLDVGCGLCDFNKYLLEQQIYVVYNGIDITPEMITESKNIYGDLNLKVHNIVNEPVKARNDYVFASGIFTYMDNLDDVESAVSNIAKSSSKGFAINSLSAWAPDKEDGDLYIEPDQLLGMCKKYTDRLVMRHDYLSHDFTIYAYLGT